MIILALQIAMLVEVDTLSRSISTDFARFEILNEIT